MTRFMQKTAAVLLLAVLVVSLTAPEAAACKKPWEKFKYDDLGEIRLPDYERVVLDNGMVLYLVEDHELPMVQLSATIQAGGIYEPAHLTGLAGITGEVLRTGGTAKWTGDEIDQLVENMGAAVETWCGQATGGAYLSALEEDADMVLEILADILMNPRFAEDKIEISKTQHKSGIARRNDEPMSIAFREFRRVMFGADHPLGRIEEYDTINSITRDDLAAFHAEYFHPDRTWLVVIGDFETSAMITKIEAAFSGWAKSTTSLPADPDVPALPRTVNVAAKDDLSQAITIIGYKGIRNDHPQYAGLVVANQILGGGFSSRLFNEIRTKRGLAYSTGSQAGTGWRFPGTFVAFTGTKNETAQQAVEVMLDEIERMRTELVTEEELRVAVDGILNGDVFNYDTKREVLDRQVLFEMYDYPEDFLNSYRLAVQGMTAEQVRTAAQELWSTDDMSILAVGNPADFDGDLSKFGPVNEIDITIPEPTMTLDVPAATPEAMAKGTELLKACRTAMSSKIAGLEGYRTELSLDLEIQGMPMSFGIVKTVQLPNRMKMVQKTPFGEMASVLDGDTAWSSGPMGKQDLPAEAVSGLQEEIDSDMFMMLKNADAVSAQALEPAEVGGVMCDRLYITGLSDDFILICLAQDTHLPVMNQSKTDSPTGSPVMQKTMYSDYKDFGGVTYYGAIEILHDDEHFAAGTVDAVELNPSLGDKDFQ